MNELSAFRGASGEVVRGFVRPATLATCVPVMVMTLAFGGFAGVIINWTGMPQWMAMAVSLVTTAPVIGLFALPARTGAFSCGFFEALVGHLSALPGFCLRFSAVGLPFAALAGLSLERLAASAMRGPGALSGALVWVALLIVGGLLGPTLGLLVAVRADTVGEALSPAAWGWALFERRADLPAYFASAIGGLALFWMLSLPIVAVLAAMAAAADPRLGAILGALAWAAPLAASPILLGRLAGAFAVGDDLDASDLVPRPSAPLALAPVPATGPTGGAAATASSTPSGAAGRARGPASAAVRAAAATPAAAPAAVSAPGTSLERKTPVQIALRRVEAMAEQDLAGALGACRELCEQEPRSAAARVLHARLAIRGGCDDEAREAAAGAILLAFETGTAGLAVELFLELSAQADRLVLPGETWLHLGKGLAARSQFAAGHWCLRAAAATGGDEKAVDKARLQLAEAALGAGCAEDALRAYESFLADRPQSAFAEFAAEGAELARRRLPQPVG